jgi:hypothetical protein
MTPFLKKKPHSMIHLSRRAVIALFCLAGFATFLTTADGRAATTNFVDGFENGLTNWVAGDGNPSGTTVYWGLVDSAFGGEGTRGGASKAYCAAFGNGGTTAAPVYQDDMSAYLSRTVDLRGYTNATLSFWSKIPSIETGYDFARVLIDTTEIWSTDRAQTSWTNVVLSLETFVGGTRSLKFEFFSDVSVTYEGWYLDDITLTDAATPAPPPTNDNFTAAQVIAGGLGSAGGTTRGATAEVSEPNPGNSIWFRWTAFTNGPVTFRTGGSAIDTILCIYTGSTLATLTPVGCDDNGGSNNSSVVTFNATGGVTYRLSVRSGGSAAGFVLLSWEQPNGLGVDLLPDITVWASQANGYLYGWYLDQSEGTAPGRTLLRASTATPNIGAGALELRGSSTTAGVYQRVSRADGSSYDRYAGTFTFHPGHGHLHFDNWLNLYLREVLPGNGVGPIVAAGDKTSFAIIDLTTYNSSLPGYPNQAQYGGGLIQGLSVGWADVYGAHLQDQWVDVTDVPSGTYWLEGVVDPLNSILESNESNNFARILINYFNPGPPGVTPPPNDPFAGAIFIPDNTAGLFANNLLATRETSEPLHFSSGAGAKSLWWRWTAPSNMSVTITTDGSIFDTVLAVYTGAAVNALTLVVRDNDAGAGNNSRVTFSATAGTTYRIAVASFATDDSGGIQLNFNPAWNDTFANCVIVSGTNGSASGSTRGANRESNEPVHAGVPGASSIWFCWTAPASGPFTFDTLGSSFDTTLGIYTGSAVNALTAIASDNDSGGGGTSRVTFNAVSNTVYRIAVDGASTANGVVKLNWAGPSPPMIVTQPLGSNVTAGASFTFRVTATGTAPMTYQWQHMGTNLTDDLYVQGANGPTLTLAKILPWRAGGYQCFVSNAYGTNASFPATLIVLDNPRVVFIDELTLPIGGVATVPIEMQSLGDEHSFRFSLAFDPALLSNPRFTNGADALAATLALDTNNLPAGRLGVTMTFPPGETIHAGVHRQLAIAYFDVNAAATAGTQAAIGFDNSPVARLVGATNDAPLTTLFAAGLITITPSNSPPWFLPLPTNYFVIRVNEVLSFTNAAADSDVPAQMLSFSLVGAPRGARMQQLPSASGVFRWTPDCAQGSTTNWITVRVTDGGTPEGSAMTNFVVVVLECVEASLGDDVVMIGGTASLPMDLLSTVKLTNLSLQVLYPQERFTNFSLLVNTQQVNGFLRSAPTNGNAQINFTLPDNRVLEGPTNIAQLRFFVVSNQPSAFVSLSVTDVDARKPNGDSVANAYGYPGRVVVVGEEPLLEAFRFANGNVQLILYALPGTTNLLQASSQLPTGGTWTAVQQVTMTNVLQIFPPLSLTNQTRFFRALRQ